MERNSRLRQARDILEIGAVVGTMAATPTISQELTQAQKDGLLIAQYLSGYPQLEVMADSVVLRNGERSVRITYIDSVAHDSLSGEGTYNSRWLLKKSVNTMSNRGPGFLWVQLREGDSTLYFIEDRGSLIDANSADTRGLELFGDVNRGFTQMADDSRYDGQRLIEPDDYPKDYQGALEPIYRGAAQHIRTRSDSVRTERKERAKRFGQAFRPQQSR